jgi:putative DNA primase/helicase
VSAIERSRSPDFAAAMLPVATEILGEPNKLLSNDNERKWRTRGSFSVNREIGVWSDFETGKGGGVLEFLQEYRGLDKESALEFLHSRDLLPTAVRSKRIAAHYDYVDEAGKLLFQVCRYETKDLQTKKTFRQRRPDGMGGWVWNINDVRRVIYRLPKVKAAIAKGETVFVVEGEKAVAAMEHHGFTATCSPGGAGKWKREYGYTEMLTGADVMILADLDDVGWSHAQQVKRALLEGQVRSVKAFRTLPNLPAKGDAHDFFALGGTAAELSEFLRDPDHAATIEPRSPRNIDEPKKVPKAIIHRKDISAAARGIVEVPTTAKLEPDTAALDGFDLNEDGIALAFVARHKGQLRYDHNAGAWFQWTGAFWQRDATKLAFSWAREMCRQSAKGMAAESRVAATIAKAATAASVERYAQSDQEMAVTSEIWDRDPWLLGTPTGTVDLRTGALTPARAEDFITKQTAVPPAAMPDCPLWLKFLDDATKSDAGLIRFLRQWCGYSLTGITREHALLFLHGPGGNGKSVFLNTVMGVMSNYGCMASMETFTAGASDKHPTDLAMLHGARMVCASETEEGRAWAETRIKQVTGGDPITARFMRRDFFTFTPTFKLVVVGNHKPVLRNVDEAARRRFNLSPFVHKPQTPDRDLEIKLRGEAPAILRWMIEGCIDWQRNGLVTPQSVIGATAEYFSEQDSVAQWIKECCETGGGNLSDTTEALFRSWTAYAIANGETPGTTRWFSQNMARHGFEHVAETPNHRKKRGFLHISVKHVDMADQR